MCHAGKRGKRPRPESGSRDRFLSQAEGSTAHLGLKYLKRASQDLVHPGGGQDPGGWGAGRATESEKSHE